MYTVFYNFKEKPFSLTPDPKFIFFSENHQEALDHMLYGISQREGFMAITGGIGTGKTTLCRALLESIDEKDKVALILNPMLSSTDLLRALVQDLGARPHYADFRTTQSEADSIRTDPHPRSEVWSAEEIKWLRNASKKELLDALNGFLLEQHAAGGSTVVIIDEAQNLSLDVMEQVRLLSNLETEKQKLLQIIFVGQTEFNEKLSLPQLKQLNQRISIRYELRPLSAEETRTYIYHRLRVAASMPRVTFSRSAFKTIYSYTQGYPRLINLVCDRALLAGYNARSKCIDTRHVRQAIKSLLGDDAQRTQFDFVMKLRLAVAASVLFFIAGSLFFLQGDPALQRTVHDFKHAINAFLPFGTAPAQVLPQGNTPASPVTEPAPNPAVPTARVDAKVAENRTEDPAEIKTIKLPVIFSREAPDEVYRIQVSSWKKKSSAARVLDDLKEKGYPAYIQESVNNGKSWYVVYAGPYEEVETARGDFQRLESSGKKPILLSYVNHDAEATP